MTTRAPNRTRHTKPRRVTGNRNRIQNHVPAEDPNTPGCCKHCNLPMTATSNERHSYPGEFLGFLQFLAQDGSWKPGSALPAARLN